MAAVATPGLMMEILPGGNKSSFLASCFFTAKGSNFNGRSLHWPVASVQSKSYKLYKQKGLLLFKGLTVRPAQEKSESSAQEADVHRKSSFPNNKLKLQFACLSKYLLVPTWLGLFLFLSFWAFPQGELLNNHLMAMCFTIFIFGLL